MGTIAANSIQPTSDSDSLSIRTGSADAERIRISSTGETTFFTQVSMLGSMTVTGSCQLNNAQVAGDLSVSARVSCSSGTTASSSSSQLTTKNYVDSQGIVILDDPVLSVVSVNLSSTHTSRQTLELHPHVPETAKYVILKIHAYALGNTIYNIWFGNTTTTNTGHRTHYQTDLGAGDATVNSTQAIIPINKISSSSRQVYWNLSTTPGTAGDDLYVDIAGYVI